MKTLATQTISGKRHLLKFATTLLVILTSVGIYSFSRGVFTDVDYNFSGLKPNERLVVLQLPRDQLGAIKIGYLKNYPMPEVVLFGNHVFRHFSENAFPKDRPDNYFFNAWYANFSLSEIYLTLAHLEQHGRVPKKVIVQVTTPNNDIGDHVINFGGELPTQYLTRDAIAHSLADGQYSWVGQAIISLLKGRISFSVFLTMPATGEDLSKRVVDVTNCPPALELCQPRVLRFGLRADGAYDEHELWRDPLVLNGDSAGYSQKLFPGDESNIADLFNRIDRLVRRNGGQAVFVIPPVYEEVRETEVDAIFNRALAMLEGIAIIDHRPLRSRADLFINYDHPNGAYFRLLADELSAKGFLPGFGAPPTR